MRMLALLVVLFAAAQASAQQTRIGAAAAVAGVVKAESAGQVGRVIGSGKPLFLNDHVTTDAGGRLQVLLLDESVFTLGPNADMVLDEFVYDPNTGAGKVAAQITKGAFRFVTGKVARSKPENMNVKLKVGTIGIRGTVVVGETSDAGSTIINAGASSDNNAGEPASNVLAENNGQTVLIAKPGDGVTIKPEGAPSAPTDMTSTLDQLSGQLSASVPPPSGQQQAAAEPAGESKASDEAGQSTAQGTTFSQEQGEVNQGSEEAAVIATIASQTQTLADGIGNWEDLVRIQGQATYSGDGNYSCTGAGSCSTPGGGTFHFDFDVDFDAKTVGNGNIFFNNGPLNADPSATINTTSWQGLSGTTPLHLDVGGGGYDGSTINFNNKDGVPADTVHMDLKYTNGNDDATGSGDAPKIVTPPS